jgi:hypothetical protein
MEYIILTFLFMLNTVVAVASILEINGKCENYNIAFIGWICIINIFYICYKFAKKLKAETPQHSKE